MKNIFVLLIFLITAATVPAAADEYFKININSGDLGIAGNIPLNDEYSRETTMSLFNIGIEDSRTGIGIGLTPFTHFRWTDSSSEGGIETTAYSLAGFSFYWNILNHKVIYIGPFTTINYLFVEDEINWNRFIFTGGLHIGFRASFGSLNYKVVSAELGYRNIDGRSRYYIGAKIDFALSLIGLLAIMNGAGSSGD